jgi:hypothetical protein
VEEEPEVPVCSVLFVVILYFVLALIFWPEIARDQGYRVSLENDGFRVGPAVRLACIG